MTKPMTTMISYKTFLLNEELITFGPSAYPKFGHIVVLAGGAGSGKGFIIKNLLGITGRILDVDASKTRALETSAIVNAVYKETGEDISKFDLRKPVDVYKLHDLLAGRVKRWDNIFLDAVAAADPGRLPNIIYDVTLKDPAKLKVITDSAKILGYPPQNIHLVWVINDFDVAMEQNATRSRVVPEEIMVATHLGAAKTMRDIMNDAANLGAYFDGSIWLAFNNKHTDVKMTPKTQHGGTSLEKIIKFKVKSVGGTIKQPPQELLDKISSYTRVQF